MDSEFRKAIREGNFERAWQIRYRHSFRLETPIESVPAAMKMPLSAAHWLSLGRIAKTDEEMTLGDFLTILALDGKAKKAKCKLVLLDKKTQEKLWEQNLDDEGIIKEENL